MEKPQNKAKNQRKEQKEGAFRRVLLTDQGKVVLPFGKVPVENQSDSFPWFPRLWSQAEFATRIGVDAHTVNRWLKLGWVPKRGCNRVWFGGRDLNRLNVHFWYLHLRKTKAGREKLRNKPDVTIWSRMWRFPAWITRPGKHYHPVLRAWDHMVTVREGREKERAGLWKFIQDYSNEKRKEKDKWGFLVVYMVSIMDRPEWPKTKKEFDGLLRFMQREFYPGEPRRETATLIGLRERIFSVDFQKECKARAVSRGIVYKPLTDVLFEAPDTAPRRDRVS